VSNIFSWRMNMWHTPAKSDSMNSGVIVPVHVKLKGVRLGVSFAIVQLCRTSRNQLL
jgi:hypothetical protein